MDRQDTHTEQQVVTRQPGYERVITPERPAVAGTKFHFIGAGGAGMSGLVKVLVKNNAVVKGSDQAGSSVVNKLRQSGADIKIGHRPDNLDPDTDTVVISAAIKPDNPELIIARHRGCKIKKYAQVLGELMAGYEGIAVAGTHGKSTTSGWLSYILKQAGAEPNFIVGARITQLSDSSGAGDGEYFVAEACEYDRSFLNLKAKIGCILNIEADHLDYYKDLDEIVDAFCRFASGIRPGGVLIANGDDQNVARVIGDCRFGDGGNDVRCETFGFGRDCNFSARNERLIDGLYRFDLWHNGRFVGEARSSLPGRHNVLNALAVTAMAVNAGLGAEQVLALLGEFAGIDRRLMLKGCFARITVLDDYAHHPTEIRASLQAIRQRYRPERLWCIFQPHQYSRTRFLLDDFAESFKLADITIVPQIYFVRDSQEAKKDVNSQILVERIRSSGNEALFIDGFGAICEHLKENAAAGDLVVTMGAGDIWKVADEYIQWLGRNC